MKDLLVIRYAYSTTKPWGKQGRLDSNEEAADNRLDMLKENLYKLQRAKSDRRGFVLGKH
jgi:hypothetical protein